MIQINGRIQRDQFLLDVNLQCPSSGVTALHGPSGCGKTSVLRMLSGLDHHPHSQITVNGEVWQNSNQFLPPHLRPIAYVFQQTCLFEHLSVAGNLQYGVKRSKTHQHSSPAMQQAIDLLGIRHLLKRNVQTLSGGEQQRVGIARALAVKPSLLLMDEPLTALDEDRKLEIFPYLESLHRELDIPIIYVSHSWDELTRLADHIALIDQGKLETIDTATAMLTRLDLPLAHRDQASTLIDTTIVEHDREYHLSRLLFAGGHILVPFLDQPLGTAVRLRLAARDISLTLQKQQQTSILNIIEARVEQMMDENDTQMTVRLLAGETPILSRITRRSAHLLHLQPGKQVYAQIKSVAVLGT